MYPYPHFMKSRAITHMYTRPGRLHTFCLRFYRRGWFLMRFFAVIPKITLKNVSKMVWGESFFKIRILGVKMPFFGPLPWKGASNVLFSISAYVNPCIWVYTFRTFHLRPSWDHFFGGICPFQKSIFRVQRALFQKKKKIL